MAVVIVTGASSGIGEATASRLGRPGMTVVLVARRAAELAAVAARIEKNGGAAVSVPADLRDPSAAAVIVERAVAAGGRLDGLVNNAGVGGIPSVLAGDDDVDTMIDVNLRAPIRLMRAAVPVMRSQGAGVIVNVGSVAGEVGISGVYSATKFGLRGMTDSVRRELAGTGVKLVLVEPGYIATDWNRDRGKLPGPGIVAAAIDRALQRPRRRIVVPAKYRAAIIAAAILPGITDRVYAGKADGKVAFKGARRP